METSDIKKLLGKRIKELRKSRKMTQEQLAEKVGIGTPNISYFETGKYTPSIETLFKIATVLNYEMYEFYCFNFHMSIKKIQSELSEVLKNDENTTRLLYKFYTSIK